MKDIGFILLSWVITVGSIATLAAVTLRRARESARVPDDKKPWL
jgi:hypothetical protein